MKGKIKLFYARFRFGFVFRFPIINCCVFLDMYVEEKEGGGERSFLCMQALS